MILDRITITGADDSVSPRDLVQLSREFPMAEWGILLSKDRIDTYRYPSKPWLDELKKVTAEEKIPLAGHVCGEWCKSLLNRENGVRDFDPELWSIFDRIQLNFNVRKVSFDPEFYKFLDPSRQYIFQMGSYGNDAFEAAREHLRVSVLFDKSGGHGKLPDEWPQPESAPMPPPDVIPMPKYEYCGYAGGLGPDVLARELSKIRSVVPNRVKVWVDMESRVRTSDDSALDLTKVRDCLVIAKTYAELCNE